MNQVNNGQSPNKLYFLRHEKTIFNRNHILSGQSESSLSSYEKISNLPKGIHTIFTSPSQRCLDTLKLLPDEAGRIPVIKDVRLLERGLGLLEGLNRVDAVRLYPHLFINSRADTFSSYPNGESYAEFKERVTDFYQSIIIKQSRPILICSHNQTLKMLYLIIKKLDISTDTWQKIDFPNGKILTIT